MLQCFCQLRIFSPEFAFYNLAEFTSQFTFISFVEALPKIKMSSKQVGEYGSQPIQ